MHDVIIVGGGAAGLGTAYYLRNSGLDVLILESGHEVGGRSQTVQLAGSSANTGAMFVYRGTKSEELVHELGIPTVPFLPKTYGIHMNGATVVAETNEDVVAGLHLTESEKTELIKFIDASLTEYQDYVNDRTAASEVDKLSAETVAERIEGLQPAVRDIIATAIRGGAVGPPDNLSAKYALRYFASYLAREKNNRLFALDGMQAIPQAILKHLPENSVRYNTRVEDVTRRAEADGAYEVLAAHHGGEEEFLAKHVVLAVPAPVVPDLVRDLPKWKSSALGRVASPGSTTLNIVANIEGLPDFTEWAFIVTVGMAFDAIINPIPGETEVTSRKFFGLPAGLRRGCAQNCAVDGRPIHRRSAASGPGTWCACPDLAALLRFAQPRAGKSSSSASAFDRIAALRRGLHLGNRRHTRGVFRSRTRRIAHTGCSGTRQLARNFHDGRADGQG